MQVRNQHWKLWSSAKNVTRKCFLAFPQKNGRHYFLFLRRSIQIGKAVLRDAITIIKKMMDKVTVSENIEADILAMVKNRGCNYVEIYPTIFAICHSCRIVHDRRSVHGSHSTQHYEPNRG